MYLNLHLSSHPVTATSLQNDCCSSTVTFVFVSVESYVSALFLIVLCFRTWGKVICTINFTPLNLPTERPASSEEGVRLFFLFVFFFFQFTCVAFQRLSMVRIYLLHVVMNLNKYS